MASVCFLLHVNKDSTSVLRFPPTHQPKQLIRIGACPVLSALRTGSVLDLIVHLLSSTSSSHSSCVPDQSRKRVCAQPAGRVAQLAHALQPGRRLQRPDAQRRAHVQRQLPRREVCELSAAGLSRQQKVPAGVQQSVCRPRQNQKAFARPHETGLHRRSGCACAPKAVQGSGAAVLGLLIASAGACDLLRAWHQPQDLTHAQTVPYQSPTAKPDRTLHALARRAPD